jgi:hypothetical protein
MLTAESWSLKPVLGYRAVVVEVRHRFLAGKQRANCKSTNGASVIDHGATHCTYRVWCLGPRQGEGIATCHLPPAVLVFWAYHGYHSAPPTINLKNLTTLTAGKEEKTMAVVSLSVLVPRASTWQIHPSCDCHRDGTRMFCALRSQTRPSRFPYGEGISWGYCSSL